MSPRARVFSVVVAAAAAAAIVAVGGAVLLDDHTPGPPNDAGGGSAAQPGSPPLALNLGVRDDAEARDLRRAAALYDADRAAPAGRIFARYRSLEARVGRAFAVWPDGSLDRLEQLGGLYPRSALVQLHVGLARFWAGKGDARGAWREAVNAEPDTPYAVTAGDLLHPEFATGLPTFVPSFELPPSVARLAPPEQLAALEHAADRNGGEASSVVRWKLLYGVALQRLGRPVSARRQFEQAVQADPQNVEALVADAVGRFDKSRPEAAFSRLGPLTKRFPEAASVRFHLGLLLLWSGQVDEAKRQLRLAREDEPGSVHAKEAERFLKRLESLGTG
jgi:tetratricopeptide (TPR) repeat protein